MERSLRWRERRYRCTNCCEVLPVAKGAVCPEVTVEDVAAACEVAGVVFGGLTEEEIAEGVEELQCFLSREPSEDDEGDVELREHVAGCVRELRLKAGASSPEALGARISDEEAAEYLKLMHQRLGHASMKYIKQLYNSGDMLGPDISESQLNDIQFFCPVCERTRQTRRPDARQRRRKPRPKLRILEEVQTDLVHMAVRSIRFRGPRGSLGGGGNRYAVPFVDRSTGRLFPTFVSRKTNYVAAVDLMVAHMEACARESCEYDGVTPIKVQKFVSDRDANLTDKKGVAAMLEKRIFHELAPADARNATPVLDAKVRRWQDISRSLLDAARLPGCFGEWAMRDGAKIQNLLPDFEHHLNHSSMRQWEGRPQDLSKLLTWGADTYPWLPVSLRKGKSKLDPMAPGGEGQYRVMGEAEGPMFGNKGGKLILNTKTNRVRAIRNFKVNERLEDLRELPLPAVDVEEEEKEESRSEGEGSSSGESEDELNEPIKGKCEDPERHVPMRRPSVKLEQRIEIRQDNPKRPGSQSRIRYTLYKGAKTVREYLESGGTRADLRFDIAHDYVRLVGMSESEVASVQKRCARKLRCDHVACHAIAMQCGGECHSAAGGGGEEPPVGEFRYGARGLSWGFLET